MQIEFPGITAVLTDEALVLCSETPLLVLSSAVVGGGTTRVRYIVNRHVKHGYSCSKPEDDLLTFGRESGITEPFVGLMTSATLSNTRVSCLSEKGISVGAVVTAGLSNPAAPGLSPPVAFEPGTINMIILADANLTPAAMVNAVTTATEVKARVLMERDVRTAEGYPATGTSTDAIVMACTGRGESLRYAGPATLVGWLVGRCAQAALSEALQRAFEEMSLRANSKRRGSYGSIRPGD